MTRRPFQFIEKVFPLRIFYLTPSLLRRPILDQASRRESRPNGPFPNPQLTLCNSLTAVATTIYCQQLTRDGKAKEECFFVVFSIFFGASLQQGRLTSPACYGCYQLSLTWHLWDSVGRENCFKTHGINMLMIPAKYFYWLFYVSKLTLAKSSRTMLEFIKQTIKWWWKLAQSNIENWR